MHKKEIELKKMEMENNNKYSEIFNYKKPNIESAADRTARLAEEAVARNAE